MSLQLKMMVVVDTYLMDGMKTLVQHLMHSIHGVTVVAVHMMQHVMIQMLPYGITVVKNHV